MNCTSGGNASYVHLAKTMRKLMHMKDVGFTLCDDKLTQVNMVGEKNWGEVYSQLPTPFLPKHLYIQRAFFKLHFMKTVPNESRYSVHRVKLVIIGFCLYQYLQGPLSQRCMEDN